VLEPVTLDVAEVRRADHVVHCQQRMAPAQQRLFLEDVDRRHARASGAQRGLEHARRNQPCATRVDQQRGRLHARQVGGGHDAAGLGDQPEVQRDHI